MVFAPPNPKKVAADASAREKARQIEMCYGKYTPQQVKFEKEMREGLSTWNVSK